MEAQNLTETTSTKKVDAKKAKAAANLNYQRDKDREKVKGIFRFHEVPGGRLEFSFKKYKGDPVERYDLVDGTQYTLPLGVARHLNSSGWYPQYEYIPGEKVIQAPGGNSIRVAKKIRRYSFQSLEFVDIDDLGLEGPKILEASMV